MRIRGWFNFHDLYDLVVKGLVDRSDWPQVAEVGVWQGASISYLAQRLREWYGDSSFSLFAVDHWDASRTQAAWNAEVAEELERLREEGVELYDLYNEYLTERGVRDCIRDVRCDSVEAARGFEDDELDFVFIDADHSEEAVYRDVLAWWSKTAVLAGHDTDHESVRAGLLRASRVLGIEVYFVQCGNCWTTDKGLADALGALRRGVMLAVPVGSETAVSSLGVNSIVRAHDTTWDVFLCQRGGSLLPHNFNALLCEALNHRKSHNLRWFVMMHSDVAPMGGDWLDRLLGLHTEYGADVLSVALPIKDGNGLTSTAVDTNLWRPRRLTMTEIESLPPTFGGRTVRQRFGADLLVNTGLMAFRLDNNWCEEVLFNIACEIHRDLEGLFRPEVEPEDWRFSRWCNARGLNVAVTREIRAQHQGVTQFINWSSWGMMPTDQMNTPENVRTAGLELAIA